MGAIEKEFWRLIESDDSDEEFIVVIAKHAVDNVMLDAGEEDKLKAFYNLLRRIA